MNFEKKVSHLWEQSDGYLEIHDLERFVADVFTTSCGAKWTGAVWLGKFHEESSDLTVTEVGYMLVVFDSVNSLPAELNASEENDIWMGLRIEDVKWDGCNHYSPKEVSTSEKEQEVASIMGHNCAEHIGLVVVEVKAPK